MTTILGLPNREHGKLHPIFGTPVWLDGEIQSYLRSGEYDCSFTGWPGDNYVDVAQKASLSLRAALVEETLRRANGRTTEPTTPIDIHAWAGAKLLPMVSGLFRAEERSVVIETLARGLIFVTSQNIVALLMQQRWLSTAWNLANLYLHSIGVPGLSPRACEIVGMSEETMCYVSTSYFHESDLFADFVVHEAAHVFHNCKRVTISLPHSRRNEYLLNINYKKRETFAYACEAYSRISLMAPSIRQRQDALARHAQDLLLADDQVDPDEYLDMLGEAVASRNGWQRILKRCAS